jgi:hypothetical protein
MIVDFARELVREFEERKKMKERGVLAGNVASFEEYKQMVGYIQALDTAISYVKELAKKADSDE